MNKILLFLAIMLLPIMAHAQTATSTMTMTSTQTRTSTATQTATCTATCTSTQTSTATVTPTFTPTPAYIPGVANANYQNQQVTIANGTYAQSGLLGVTGMAVTIGSNFINTIWKYWSVVIKGSGGSGAVTASAYPIVYPNGPPVNTAALAVTGAGNTTVGGYISTPIPAWGMAVSISGIAASTTAVIQGVGQN